MLTTHLIEQIMSGTTPVGTAFNVTVDHVGLGLGDRLTVSLTFSIVDKDNEPLVILEEVKRLHQGDTVTIAEIHQAFHITISGN